MNDTIENDLRRLRMRSWRRGMKEMDLIFGRFADEAMSDLSPSLLAEYESSLSENDQDLYLWVTARLRGAEGSGPAEFDAILAIIADHVAKREKI